MSVYAFDSTDELLAHMEASQAAADKAAESHHIKVEDVKHGDYVISVREDQGVVIFGEVFEHTAYPEDAEDIVDSRKRGYIFGRWYSVMCPEGELGDTHITQVTMKITKEAFKLVQSNGWRHAMRMS